MARLSILQTEGKNEFELNERARIGRHPDNSIHLPDRLVSKQHTA